MSVDGKMLLDCDSLGRDAADTELSDSNRNADAPQAAAAAAAIEVATTALKDDEARENLSFTNQTSLATPLKDASGKTGHLKDASLIQAPVRSTSRTESPVSTSKQHQQRQQQKKGSTQTTSFKLQLPVSTITITMYIPTSAVQQVMHRQNSIIAQIQTEDERSTETTTTSITNPLRISICPSKEAGLGLSGTNIVTANTKNFQTGVSSTATASSTSTIPTYTPLDESDPQWTPVVIQAELIQAWKTANAIASIVTGNTSTFASSLLPNGTNSTLQDSIVDIPLHRQRHATLVGKKGWTLAQTSASTHCRIWVPPKELKLDLIQLEGPLPNIEACIEAMSKLLFKNNNNNNSHGNNNGNSAVTGTTSSPQTGKSNKSHKGIWSYSIPLTGGDQGKESSKIATTTDTLPVTPPSQAPPLQSIIPSLTKTRSVGRKTDTVLKKKKMEDGTWAISISGATPSHIEAAQAMLTKWAEGAATGGSAKSNVNPIVTNTNLDTKVATSSGSDTASSISPVLASTPSPRGKSNGRGSGRGSGRGRGRGKGRGGGGGRGKGGQFSASVHNDPSSQHSPLKSA